MTRQHGAYIPARYSTGKQNEDSIEVQVERCSDYCKAHNIPVLGVFADMAVSGMKETRPEFERMMRQLRAGGADTVVMYDQSRMFRKLTAWFEFRDEMEAMGVTVISITQPMIGGDLSDPANFLTEGAMALFNQMWCLQTGQKVKAKMEYMATQGKHTGGKPAFGYQKTADGFLEICEPEADIVRLIFDRYANGSSMRQICDELKCMGAKTKLGGDFGSNSLHDLLKNQKYIGNMVYGRQRRKGSGKRTNNALENCVIIENAIPAIVDLETWEKVQQRMKDNKKAAAGRPVAAEPQPLKGKVYCGECGSSMTVEYSGSRSSGARHSYYGCAAKKRKGSCEAKPINRHWLEDAVLQAVRGQLQDPGNQKTLVKIMRDERDKLQGSCVPMLQSLIDQRNGAQKKLDNALDAVLSGLNSPALKKRIAELEDTIAGLDHKMQLLHNQVQMSDLSDDAIASMLKAMIDAGSADDDAIFSLVVRVDVFADTIAVYTIIDRPPDKGRGSIDKHSIVEIVDAGRECSHNSTSPVTGTNK